MGGDYEPDKYECLRSVSSNWSDGFTARGAEEDTAPAGWNESEEPSSPEPVKTKPVSCAASRQHTASNTYSTLNIGCTGYPYVIFHPDVCGFSPKDRFTLESADGSYRETLLLEEAKRTPTGPLVLWFSLPPGVSKCHLRVDPPEGEEGASYYVFKDQPLTYR